MDIKFNVSAKTARLIGRENIADVDGAVIELVKNAYDADASCCLIKFNIPFPNINIAYDRSFISGLLNSEDKALLLKYCDEKDGKIVKKENLTFEQEAALEKILFAYNTIVIADNGQGMTKHILANEWMNIGTDNKEKNYSSEKGRVKTGAKGIGRFALDKLSLNSVVFSKNKTDELYNWSLSWEDFDKVKLLSEVTAQLSPVKDKSLEDIVNCFFESESNLVKCFSWETGTVIVLSPLREQWNERLFGKVIKNMRSLNPLNSVDRFDVHLLNTYFKEYSTSQESSVISRNDYDYKIQVVYDGSDKINLKIDRNEVDISLEEVDISDKDNDRTYKLNMNEFWNREKFQRNNYRKEDYDKEISFDYCVKDFYRGLDDVINFKKIGKFSFEVLFLKADNSTLEIVKRIPVRSRKKILDIHSGIKIYRDNFKVRPYGDDGPLFDWLNLGKRSQKSPAAVTHESGSWRVQPYQVIGNLKISRIDNPRLEDMANREAIALNDSYYLLIDFLQKMIEKFEYDRQYILREYALWTKLEIEKSEPEKTAIIKHIKNKSKNKEQRNRENDDKYSKEQYEEVISDLSSENENEINAQELLMMFSTSGIMANTFSHELHRISTDFGTRIQHLRSSIIKLVRPETYSGDPDYNPFPMLDECQQTDELLSHWIKVIMDGIQGNALVKEEINLSRTIDKIIKIWRPLLSTKHISINFNSAVKDIHYSMSIADVYLILNNFILNSAWFLENGQDRNISIDLSCDEKTIDLTLKNNGEKLDDKYKDNPYRIFEIGETSKYKKGDDGEEEKIGTGIGLWIIDQCVKKYGLQISLLLDLEQGFGFVIKFSRS